MTAIHRTKRSIPILFVVHILSSVSIYKLEKGKVFSDYYMRLCAFAGGGVKKISQTRALAPMGKQRRDCGTTTAQVLWIWASQHKWRMFR